MLLKELTNLSGVSGNEKKVREFIISQISDYCDKIEIDSIGNIIALKKGKQDKKVMLAAHMDEVGFIISDITDKGFLKFKTVGGIDTRTILAKRLKIGENEVLGVIGMKAVHLQKKSERDNVPEIRDLYIDIGAKDKESAEKLVKLGDYAVFDTEYEKLGENTVKAKAIDDRAGCAVLIELMKKPQKYDTYFCFTTQEEVGLRGARLAAYKIKPDISLVIEATSCSDVYGFEPYESVTKMGAGAAVTFMDRTTIVDDTLRKKIFEMGKATKIPVQYKSSTSGGNDAGRIHISGEGIRTAVISLPCRYIHSCASVASLTDFTAVKNLAELFLERIDEVL
ncbi:MAG: M42 family metallopeptidase [Firmicutes bacterium]|nr:M42 family metallopeptidase [Bacillota bacterium]